jgi:hypothetical protein
MVPAVTGWQAGGAEDPQLIMGGKCRWLVGNTVLLRDEINYPRLRFRSAETVLSSTNMRSVKVKKKVV